MPLPPGPPVPPPTPPVPLPLEPPVLPPAPPDPPPLPPEPELPVGPQAAKESVRVRIVTLFFIVLLLPPRRGASLILDNWSTGLQFSGLIAEQLGAGREILFGERERQD